jgi:hypothetical protein
MGEVTVKGPSISPKEYERYRGKNVAIYNGKIVAAAQNSVEALQKALKKNPKLKPSQIEIEYIQSSDELIF